MAPRSALNLRRDAETLAAPFPPLLAEAERVAAIVAQGVHGRRRSGQGETFWQYRNYDSSDAANRIDWRRSARADNLYVRETEWEAANTVWMWRDGNSGMDWTSNKALPSKQERASVILMALASLLMRAGERCAVLGESERPRTGRAGLEQITYSLATSTGQKEHLSADIPPHARLVLASDFLESPAVWTEQLARFSARPARGVMLHVIDPAEESFPYRGRMKMSFPGGKLLQPLIVGRAEKAQEAYRDKFEAHKAAIADSATRLGWTVITHHTDQPATRALTALYNAFSLERR